MADEEQQIRQQAEQIAEQKRQIADAERQIVDLERELALHKLSSTKCSKTPPPMVWRGNPGSGADARRAAARRMDNRIIVGRIDLSFPPPKRTKSGPSYRTGASTAVIRWPAQLDQCRRPENRSGIK